MEAIVWDLHGLLLELLELLLGQFAGQDRLLGSLPVNDVLQLSGSKVETGILPRSWQSVAKLVAASDLENGGDCKFSLLHVFTTDHSL